jgi:hypothetical protein
MIIDKKVNIVVSKRTIKYYTEKGYNNLKLFDIVEIDIGDLQKCSSLRINVKCDICKSINNIQFYNYNNCLKKQGLYVCKMCKTHKTKKTNLKKYGKEWGLQNNAVKEKSKITLLEKYGVDNISKVKYIKESRKNNFTNEVFKEKSKKTILEKYGVDNISKSEIFKNKKKETCLKNWGVENPTQSSIIFNKSQKSGKKIKLYEELNIYYRGSYELDFLNYCLNNNIDVQKGKTITYYKDNKKKYYHSDFYLPYYNLICEIKSDYYYKKYYELNLLKKRYTKNLGYNFIFIINKDYNEFDKFRKRHK